MESSSSQSVNPIPSWGGSNRNQSNRASDPMAFFDLIMDSARSSLAQGNKSLDPTSAATSSASPQGNEPAASSDDASWRDDQRDDTAAAYAPASAPTNDIDKSAEAGNENTEDDDVAAVVELESNESSQDEPSDEPDQAAQETAAAAGQSEQLLGAPDTLETGEEAVEASGEDVPPTEAKPTLPGEPKAAQTIATDKPLDTSADANDGDGESTDADTPEVEVAATQDVAKKEDEPKPEASEEASLDVEPTEAASEAVADHAERDSESAEVNSEERQTEASTPEEASAEQETRDDSPREGKESARTRQNDKAEAKPQSAATTETTSVSVTPAQATSTAAAETVAASSTPAATSTQSSSPNSQTPTPTGNTVTNLASLLQRGLQRGTLQKSTEGKPTTQLDPKQQIRLINRVARAVESTPAGQSIKIRLNPSELGQLKVEIKIENGNMVAKIEAENPATRQVLLHHLPQLRDRLAESNINVQQFDVDVMGQQSSADGGAANLGDQQADSGSSSGGSRQWNAPSGGDDEGTAPRAEQINKEAERDSRNLNVTI